MSVKRRVWGECWRSGFLFHWVFWWSISCNVFPFFSRSLRLLSHGDDPRLWLRCKSICRRHFLCVFCEKVSDEIEFKKQRWSDQEAEWSRWPHDSSRIININCSVYSVLLVSPSYFLLPYTCKNMFPEIASFVAACMWTDAHFSCMSTD